MDWVLLVLAGMLEIIGVIGIKRVAERSNLMNNVVLIGGFIVSFFLLTTAMTTISLSTAYAVWTGIGTVGAAIVGILVYRESKKPLRLACMAGVIVCVIGLKLVE